MDNVRLVIVIANPKALDVFFRRQVQFLQSHGFLVHAISSPGPELAEFQAATGATVEEIPIERRIRPLADLVTLFRLWKALRRQSPDAVHAHTPKAGLLGIIAAAAARVPVRFFTWHGLRSETLAGWPLRVMNASDRLTSALATHTLAVSPSLRRCVVERGLCPAEKIRVVGNGACAGVDLYVFDPAVRGARDRRQFRKEYGIPGDAPVIAFVGRIARDKGIDELADAWESLRGRHPEARLFFCGFEDADDPVDPATLARLHADPRVSFSGKLLRDMPNVYAGIDILAMPSYREGFGVAAIEAAAMGIPVVGCRIDGMMDAVHDGVTGILVPPHNSTLLAQAIDELLTDEAKRGDMAAASRPFAAERFSSVDVSRGVLNEYRWAMAARRQAARKPSFEGKRLFDFAAALLLAIATAPLLLLAAAAVRLRLGSPVLFRQERGGLNGRSFTLFKLRTMNHARDAAGTLLPDDLRLTPLGRFLRQTSMDELPQLWNVLRGDMSLVGPRPLLASYRDRYSPTEARRHEVRPGITGWTQVNGRNALSWQEKFRLDVWYVDHCSFLLDARILLSTAWRAVRPSGIEAPGRQSVREFIGTPDHS